MTRRRGESREAAPGIAPVYEGPEVLTALLGRAGSPHDTDEVAALFTRAQHAGEPRSAVIPGLFPEEPHFEAPDDARRLYANLFGLWARIAAGLGPHDDAPEVVVEPAPPPPLPDRGSVPGNEVTPDVVDAVWRHLAAAPSREVQRRRDRFTNVQPDVAAWLEAAPLPQSGALAAMDLAFETWMMLDEAFGDRLGAAEYAQLRALEREPPPLEATQPALASYVTEQLDLLEAEDAEFGDEDRAQVERTLATIAAALTEAVRAPSAQA